MDRPLHRRGLLLLLLALPAGLVALCLLLFEADPVLLASILSGMEVLSDSLLTVLLWAGLPAAFLILLLAPTALPRLRLLLGRLRGRLAFDRKAASALLERLENFPNLPDLLALAQLYLDSGQGAMALAPLKAALELEPDHARSRFLLALCLRDLGRPGPAFEQASRALELEPDLAFGQALFLATELALQLGLTGEGLALAQRLRQSCGDALPHLLLLARAQHDAGLLEDRAATLRLCLDLAPEGRPSPEEILALSRVRRALRKGGRP